MVNNSLPKISYLTILDKVMLLCFAAIFFVGLESFAVYLLSKYGGDKNADEDDVDGGGRSIDMHMRYVYPLVFVACQARVAWGAVATRARLIGDGRGAVGAGNDWLEAQADAGRGQRPRRR